MVYIVPTLLWSLQQPSEVGEFERQSDWPKEASQVRGDLNLDLPGQSPGLKPLQPSWLSVK